MTFSPNPVQFGFAASLAHPGGNITGLSDQAQELLGKKVELIRLIAPGTKRIGVLMINSAGHRESLDVLSRAAKTAGVVVSAEQVPSAAELEKAVRSLKKKGISAVVIFGGPPFVGLRKAIAGLATRSKMFTISPTRAYVDDGGLLSYGSSPSQQNELAAGYVDKILKGAKPGDLPIQQPTKFELVINRKTADALGMKLSPELLLRADEVIE